MALRLGGMTAHELMDRMSVDEIREWVEYDRSTLPDGAHQFAALMAKLDWIKGVKRPDPSRYLPKARAARGARTLAEVKARFAIAAANSTRTRPTD